MAERPGIENQAKDLAHKLDAGRGMQVADILRDEFKHMTPQDYNKLVNRTVAHDDKGYGANIEVVRQNGLIIIDTGKGEIPVGTLKEERRPNRPNRPDRNDRDDREETPGLRPGERLVCADAKQKAIESAGAGALIGGIGGLILGDKGKAAAIGAAGGAVVGGIYGHESAKNDCVIVRDRR